MSESNTKPSECLHVAVAVIVNDQRQVLISQRHPESHQGGCWEFPGGKLEEGESVQDGLRREIAEELGLQLRRFHPVKKILYHYPEKSVLLDVWQVTEFNGEARGLEGQALAWRPVSALADEDFPPANVPIIRLLNLPQAICITPDYANIAQMQQMIEVLTTADLPLIQFRQQHLHAEDYLRWFELAQQLCSEAPLQLMFNGDIESFRKLRLPAGFHASSKQLIEMQGRPVEQDFLFSASCHNHLELQQAEQLGADFAYLSPVNPTATHTDATPLGWTGFERLAGQVSLPVYALGGMTVADITGAHLHGAQGIAGIRCFMDQ